MKHLVILLCLLFTLACENRGHPPLRGVVVGKAFYPAYTTWVAVHSGRYSTTMIPINHPARWSLTIRPPWGTPDGEYDRRIDVEPDAYDRAERGDVLGPELETPKRRPE